MDSILFLSFFDPWDVLEGQEGLALKVISFQFVIVINCYNQASPGSQALIQRHHAAAADLDVRELQDGHLRSDVTYNSNDSSKRGLRSQLLTWVQRVSTTGKTWFGSRVSCTNGSLKPDRNTRHGF